MYTLSNETDGFWSQEGVATEVTFFDEEKKTYDVICTSDHLTSFAVMLDVNMALSVSSHHNRPLYGVGGGGAGGGGGGRGGVFPMWQGFTCM